MNRIEHYHDWLRDAHAMEKQMADWLIQHIPQTTEKFLIRSETDDVEAKK